jgi:hypothetical protein
VSRVFFNTFITEDPPVSQVIFDTMESKDLNWRGMGKNEEGLYKRYYVSVPFCETRGCENPPPYHQDPLEKMVCEDHLVNPTCKYIRHLVDTKIPWLLEPIETSDHRHFGNFMYSPTATAAEATKRSEDHNLKTGQKRMREECRQLVESCFHVDAKNNTWVFQLHGSNKRRYQVRVAETEETTDEEEKEEKEEKEEEVQEPIRRAASI